MRVPIRTEVLVNIALRSVAMYAPDHNVNTENRHTFDKCNNSNGHGHNYKLEVTLFGPVDPKTGMVMNLTELHSVIQRNVLDFVDHKNLDKDVNYFRDNSVVSTTENLAVFIWNQLLLSIPRTVLHEVKLWETDKNVITYRGD
ncbi:6-pyruvoyltetrahydropterin/6-carboxytetrahydropterin synthase [Paragonimus westermani]|uniref:6-pyruvoyl tetrahydrobiopterin synthase n=1 Tax=Paragonimus westermani TaxID=34504 RepID=A0A5J4NPB6_9TREM|nr:6-pyruvoyltetrahydropterin/6-carboxytetrahydropterin synthase [Paragonimus westermani]